MRSRRALVTGVAGFIASHLARRLVAEGWDVIGVDDLSTGHERNIPPGIQFVRTDLSDSAQVESLPGDYAAILHLAGQSSGEISFDDPVADLRMNTIGTLNLLRHGSQHRVGRIVYASSMSVYGSVPDEPISERTAPAPLSCYGVGKLASEGYLRVYGRSLPFVGLRMFNVYGPGQDLKNLRQGMVSIYLAQALQFGRIEVKGSLERFRDFVYIDDVVEAWWRALIRDEGLGRFLNVGTGQRTTVGQLLEAICAHVPEATSFVGHSTLGDQSGIYADVEALRKSLGFVPATPLATGLGAFVNWAKSFQSEAWPTRKNS